MCDKKTQEKQKAIYLILIMLCLISFVGHILPLINININNLSGELTSTDLSLFSVFEDSNSLLGSESILASDRFSEVADVLSNNTQKIKTIMISFVVSLFTTIIVFVFVITNKFKAITTIMLIGVLVLLIYTGITISNLCGQLIKSLEQGLGFFASFINISDLISIKIGAGYWVTISSIGCLLLVQLASNKMQKYDISISHK